MTIAGPRAAGVDVVKALAIDIEESAARRQRGFDLARGIRRKPNQTGNEGNEQQNGNDDEYHDAFLRGRGGDSFTALPMRHLARQCKRALCRRRLDDPGGARPFPAR